MHLRNTSSPRRSSSAVADLAPPLPRRRSRVPASFTIRAASSTDRSVRSRRAVPLQRLDRLDHFERVADVPAERGVHRGDERGRLQPVRACRRARATRPAPAHRSRVFMNAPRPHFTSITRPADPLRDLLAQDRRGDERDALDGAGHVAQGVERLVRRGDVGRLADHPEPDRSQRVAELGFRQVRRGSRGSIRACRACRRCGRARGRTSSARPPRTPPPAGRGSATSCRRRRRCCACRPSGRGCRTGRAACRSRPSPA